ncbi:MAG TPA: hypothetical protein VJA94_12325 [Candidatus Angelobacter sp.]
MASMRLAAIGHHKVGMGITGGQLFKASLRIGELIKSLEWPA